MCVVPYGWKNKKCHLQNSKWHFDTLRTLHALENGSDTLWLYYSIAVRIRQ